MIENEVLKPAIDRFFDIALFQGRLPPLPKQLPQGMEIKIEYTSFLSQAKRQIGMSSIQQALGFAQSQAQLSPGSQVIWNAEEAQREVNKSLGVNPRLLLGKKAMNAVRVAQAKQAQQNDVAKAIDVMGKTKIGGKNIFEHMAARAARRGRRLR
jgi:hypothetical protein